jgi:protein-tyrosine phosphatase
VYRTQNKMIAWWNKYIVNEEANKLTEIIPGKLYLGNWKSAYYLPSEIKHVVNMTPYIPNFHSRNIDITYLSCPIPDTADSDVAQHFEQSYQFINEIAKDGPVLVHCVQGASRSVSVVLAFLMRKNNWDVQTALEYVQQKRSVAKPNTGFMEQLHKYAKQIGTEE